MNSSDFPQSAKTLASEAAKDLEQLLSGIPDATLAKDWDYLCRQMRRDLLVSPADVLADLNALRRSLLKTGGARMFMIGASATRQKLNAGVSDLLAALDGGEVTPAKYTSERFIDDSVRERAGIKERPIFVGLVNPNTQGGVFPQLSARGQLSGRRQPRTPARLSQCAPLLRGRCAQHFHQDLGSRAGLLKRLWRRARNRPD